MMNITKLSICGLNSLDCDFYIKNQSNKLVFFSVVGSTTLVKMSMAKLKEKTNAYCSISGESFNLTMPSNEYEIKMKKQLNGDYMHAVGYLKDKITESTFSKLISFYVYYNKGNIEERNNKIYDKIYKNLSVPIIEDWKEYIISELINKYFITETISSNDKAIFECALCSVREETIEEIITNGLKENKISINGNNNASPLIDSISGLDDYLNVFGEILASKIQKSFVPKFIPGEQEYTEYVDNYDDNIYGTGIEMYEAQKSVVQSAVNCLNTEDVVFVIGEMGSGKTLQGAGITYAHHANRNNRGLNSIIICPGHLKEKWKREIERFVPNSRGFIIKSIDDLLSLEQRLRNKKKIENTYIIISKEDAKTSYDKMPTAIWSKTKNTFVCPECGGKLTKKEKSNYVDFGQLDMLKEASYNKKCNNSIKKWDNKKRRYDHVTCGSHLWSTLNKKADNNKWLKLGANGWIQREHIQSIYNYLDLKSGMNRLDKKEKSVLARIKQIKEEQEQNNGEIKEILKGTRRYSVAKYIKDRMSKVFDYCIVDEAHEYKSDSIQGQAACDLIKSSKKSILLTGTLLNGYSSGLFYLLYRTLPRLLKREGINYNQEMEFVRRYGVTQNSFEQRKNKKASSTEKELPGISPLVFTNFLLDNAVFLSLSDMSEGLPNYEEIPIGISMDSELYTCYKKFEKEFNNQINKSEKGSRKIMGRMVESLTNYADCPNIEIEVRHPDTDMLMIKPDVLSKVTRNKEKETIKLIKEKVANGEKVLVYYSWINKSDIASSLTDLLKEEGIRVGELTSKIKQENREEWISKQLEDGLQVLICNPKLVETGLDLLDFTSIIFYQMGYNLFTLRQASRRSWRLSQDKDIKVYFMYYKDTIQERAVKLMASKLQASMALEGKFSEEGLRAMSNNEDMLTKVAGSVVDGIKETVDKEIFASAKFMKAEKRRNRVHLKTRSMLNVEMDEHGLRKLIKIQSFIIKSNKKVDNKVNDIINNYNNALNFLSV